MLEPGKSNRVISGTAPLLKGAHELSGRVNEAHFGDIVSVLSFPKAGWARVRTLRDDYPGYMHMRHLGRMGPEPTHRVAVLRVLAHTSDDIESQVQTRLSLNCEVVVTKERGRFAHCKDAGWLLKNDLLPIGYYPDRDHVAFMEEFLGTVYLWGGSTAWEGADCSGAVQMACRAAGHQNVPRDTKDQLTLGTSVLGGPYQRGDMFFWKGHVAVLTSATQAVHATGYWRRTVREPIDTVIARYSRQGKDVLDVRRFEDYAYA